MALISDRDVRRIIGWYRYVTHEVDITEDDLDLLCYLKATVPEFAHIIDEYIDKYNEFSEDPDKPYADPYIKS